MHSTSIIKFVVTTAQFRTTIIGSKGTIGTTHSFVQPVFALQAMVASAIIPQVVTQDLTHNKFHVYLLIRIYLY